MKNSIKRISIIILLAALVLGAFTACNPEPKKAIYLELISDCKPNWRILDGSIEVTQIAISVPDGATTWQDLVDGVLKTITAKHSTEGTFVFGISEGDVVEYEQNGWLAEVLVDENIYSDLPKSEKIEVGKTYYLRCFRDTGE